jgi:hypothetical protein
MRFIPVISWKAHRQIIEISETLALLVFMTSEALLLKSES